MAQTIADLMDSQLQKIASTMIRIDRKDKQRLIPGIML
jgi:hypothetical protein